MKRAEGGEEFVIMVRSLQAMHADAHAALLNWGAWSRDRRGIFPGEGRTRIWDGFDRGEWDKEGYGEVKPEEGRTIQVSHDGKRPRAEPRDAEEYDELAGSELDQRIHGNGGLPEYMRHVLRAAYVTREIPEEQFPRMCGCLPDVFRERLETCLLFVNRNLARAYKR